MSEALPETALTLRPAHIRHGSSIGQPLTRLDGMLKVTGAAKYAADQHPPGMLYAVLAVSSIARGRVAFLDVAAAKAHPGVVEVITPANRGPLAQDPDEKSNPFMFRLDLLQSDRVRYANQPIAIVVAETLEAATQGAALLAPRYEVEPARVGLDADESFVPATVGVGMPALVRKGDVAAGLASAARTIVATYETPAQYHNPMEPHAIVAAWDGDTLSIDTPSQGMAMAVGRLAGIFGISPDRIHIRSPFLGGGFGCKGFIAGPQVLGVIAARAVGRPVKLVLRRDQMFGPVGHRGATRQTVRLGADRDGKLVAIDHHTKTTSSTFDDFFEPASDISHTLYASPAIATSHEAVRTDIGTPLFMRAPGEATGSVALESAIDEMAHACGMDPLTFRLANYAEVEPISYVDRRRLPGVRAGRQPVADRRAGRRLHRPGRRDRGGGRLRRPGADRRQCPSAAATAAASWRSVRTTWAGRLDARSRRSRRSARLAPTSRDGRHSDLPDGGIAITIAATASCGIHNAGGLTRSPARRARDGDQLPKLAALAQGVADARQRRSAVDDGTAARELRRHPRRPTSRPGMLIGALGLRHRYAAPCSPASVETIGSHFGAHAPGRRLRGRRRPSTRAW